MKRNHEKLHKMIVEFFKNENCDTNDIFNYLGSEFMTFLNASDTSIKELDEIFKFLKSEYIKKIQERK